MCGNKTLVLIDCLFLSDNMGKGLDKYGIELCSTSSQQFLQGFLCR